MRRATSFIYTSERKILRNSPSIILVLTFGNVKTLIMLMTFLVHARRRPTWFFASDLVPAGTTWPLVYSVTTDLSSEHCGNRLHKHEYTVKEIKRNTTPSNHDDDLTYATSSPEASDESCENEHSKVQRLGVTIGHWLEPSSRYFDVIRPAATYRPSSNVSHVKNKVNSNSLELAKITNCNAL